MAAPYTTKQSQRPKRWHLIGSDADPAATNEKIRTLSSSLGIAPLAAQLLINRGISDPNTARAFLNPSLNDLLDPADLTGIAPAVKRIEQAVRNNEKIVLYGDYDVDGITGIAILWHCLKLTGYDTEYYVPHRTEEGYGLNRTAIDQFIAKGTTVMITIDCGITAYDEIAHAAANGIDVILTDHHKLEGPLPPAMAIVHPDLPDQHYGNTALCGAGVAFKLAWALAQRFSGAEKVTPEFRSYLLSATSLAALGTIADMVPLTGENRILARFGLQGLPAVPLPGMAALIEAAGLSNKPLNSTDIGFALAPRLNAAGRMGHAQLAVELFTRSSAARATAIAVYLESQNRQRQKAQRELLTEALQQVKANGLDGPDQYGLVLSGENWHGGIVGLVASGVVDAYHKPTVILSCKNGQASGSARSVEGFDLFAALQACSEHLEQFGGHAMAAGLRIAPENIAVFADAFNTYVKKNLDDSQRAPVLNLDATVRIDELDMATMNVLEHLEPFGQGNPKILLSAEGLTLAAPVRLMGKKSDHLQLTVCHKDIHRSTLQPGQAMRAVGFGMGKLEKKFADADHFDVVFEPVINHFNGNSTVEMMLKDIRIHKA